MQGSGLFGIAAGWLGAVEYTPYCTVYVLNGHTLRASWEPRTYPFHFSHGIIYVEAMQDRIIRRIASIIGDSCSTRLMTVWEHDSKALSGQIQITIVRNWYAWILDKKMRNQNRGLAGVSLPRLCDDRRNARQNLDGRQWRSDTGGASAHPRFQHGIAHRSVKVDKTDRLPYRTQVAIAAPKRREVIGDGGTEQLQQGPAARERGEGLRKLNTRAFTSSSIGHAKASVAGDRVSTILALQRHNLELLSLPGACERSCMKGLPDAQKSRVPSPDHPLLLLLGAAAWDTANGLYLSRPAAPLRSSPDPHYPVLLYPLSCASTLHSRAPPTLSPSHAPSARLHISPLRHSSYFTSDPHHCAE